MTKTLAPLVLIKLLNEKETADVIGVSPATLQQWRTRRKKALPFIKAGKVIRYKPEDVARFIETQRVEPVASGRRRSA